MRGIFKWLGSILVIGLFIFAGSPGIGAAEQKTKIDSIILYYKYTHTNQTDYPIINIYNMSQDLNGTLCGKVKFWMTDTKFGSADPAAQNDIKTCILGASQSNIRDFQEKINGKVDGAWGPGTWRDMFLFLKKNHRATVNINKKTFYILNLAKLSPDILPDGYFKRIQTDQAVDNDLPFVDGLIPLIPTDQTTPKDQNKDLASQAPPAVSAKQDIPVAEKTAILNDEPEKSDLPATAQKNELAEIKISIQTIDSKMAELLDNLSQRESNQFQVEEQKERFNIEFIMIATLLMIVILALIVSFIQHHRQGQRTEGIQKKFEGMMRYNQNRDNPAATLSKVMQNMEKVEAGIGANHAALLDEIENLANRLMEFERNIQSNSEQVLELKKDFSTEVRRQFEKYCTIANEPAFPEIHRKLNKIIGLDPAKQDGSPLESGSVKNKEKGFIDSESLRKLKETIAELSSDNGRDYPMVDKKN